MPTPSGWAIGVAAPAGYDPYVELEGATGVTGRPGVGVTVPSYAGGVSPPTQKVQGHFTEAFNPHEPAFWVLAAILLFTGIIHIGGGMKVGKVAASLEA